jgi:signal transduction histidine kinase
MAADLAVLILLYTVAAYRPRQASIIALLICLAGTTVAVWVWGPVPGVRLFWRLVFAAFVFGGLELTVWILGDSMRYRRGYYAALEDKAARLEAERNAQAKVAAAAERARIARELHDVVAHNVSLMVIQAQALQTTAEDPEAARRGAHTIAELGRDAMSEMHRTLELMRTDETAEERKPQPALDDLGPLLERARAAGVDVQLAVKGAPKPLPAGVELSAYRIVQEALTNVIKHSGSDTARVELRYGDAGLELEIIDHGGGGGEPGVPTSGHGLVGMRERAALFGGSLDAGPQDGNGYRVLATLPYTA